MTFYPEQARDRLGDCLPVWHSGDLPPAPLTVNRREIGQAPKYKPKKRQVPPALPPDERFEDLLN